MSSRRTALLAALLVLLPLLALPAAARLGDPAPAVGGPLEVRVLGTRADTVTAGDALVEVVVPAGARLRRVDVDGRDVTRLFVRRTAGSLTGRTVARLEGLRLGRNHVTARLADGRGARLEVTNSRRGGPVLSGPQVQPWVCTTEQNGLGAPQDAQCNGRTTYRFVYKDAVTGRFTAYDPESPPPSARVARTTTDQGRTVPYVVRVERGTLNRGIYDVAVLYDPARAFQPWDPQGGWNRKLAYLFGQGCAPGHSQAGAVDVVQDMMIKRGFMVASSTLNTMGNACNLNVSAETTMMVKERITEQYGEIRYTIGDGCSGGSEGQNSLAENYPGLLDGIRPTCTFADGWTPAVFSKSDCALLEHYFQRVSPHLWADPLQRGAVVGSQTDSACLEMQALGSDPQDWDPTTGCGLPEGQVWDPATRKGTRCTLQDYNRASLGMRDAVEANGVLDDVGVEWGLQAFREGRITAEQFVDLNEGIGGWSRDHRHQAGRTVGDVSGIVRMYSTGQLSWGTELGRIPTIDVRTDNTADFHGNVHREVVRERVLRARGDAGNQAHWFEPLVVPVGLPTPVMAEKSFVVMDAWLAAVEADRRPGTYDQRVARNRPAEAVDGCWLGGQRVDRSECDAVYTEHSLPRMVAGMPATADVLKCRLKPLLRAEHEQGGVGLSDAQWARLQRVFPDGVCDWSRPGVGQGPPKGRWLTFADGPGGQPLGAAPRSRAV